MRVPSWCAACKAPRVAVCSAVTTASVEIDATDARLASMSRSAAGIVAAIALIEGCTWFTLRPLRAQRVRQREAGARHQPDDDALLTLVVVLDGGGQRFIQFRGLARFLVYLLTDNRRRQGGGDEDDGGEGTTETVRQHTAGAAKSRPGQPAPHAPLTYWKHSVLF